MSNLFRQMWSEEEGVLSFEWILLITLLTIGIVGGIAGMRDALIDELGDVAEAALNIDQSYTLVGITVEWNGETIFSTPDNGYVDTYSFTDCERAENPTGQPALDDL